MVNIQRLREIVGSEWVVTKREEMLSYLADETNSLIRPKPADNVVVVKPKSSEEISEILRLANIDKMPVFVRGGGTGICGGAVPIADGILISMERLDKVIEVDRDNLMIIVEAGVTLARILKEADAAGLIFPPHPGDEGAQAGGMVALNAGGTRAVKYGVVRNYVKGLEVVLPTGEILSLGGKLLKNNQGLDLLHLMVNSGGILGVITKVIFRLYPKSAASGTLLISYNDRHIALDAVPKILQKGITPLAIEYVERLVVETSEKYLRLKWPATKGQAYLMAILVGASEEDVYSQAEQIVAICEAGGAVETIIAESKEEQATILKIRSEMYSSLKPDLSDVIDITVPPASIGILMDKVDEIASTYKTVIPMYGHAADGNLHPHIMRDVFDRGILKEVKRDIYREAIKLGGVITGEHGIGVIRVPDLAFLPEKKSWELMRGIKNLFDPNNVLNPGMGLMEK